MNKSKIIIAAFIGLMAFYSCETEEDDPVTPQTQNNSGNTGGGNSGGGSTNQPSQSLRNHPLSTITMTDTLTQEDTNYVFNHYSVFTEIGNNGDSTITIRFTEDQTFGGGDDINIVIVNGSGNPFIPSSNKVFDYRTDPINTYPNTGQWQLRLCPTDRVPSKPYDCYTQSQGPAPFYRILSKTKLFYERSGDKHTFMFENHPVDDRTFTGRFEFTNAAISQASYDGTEEKGDL